MPLELRTDYAWEEIEARQWRAISRVMDNDRSLLEHGPSERAVAHRLAVYLEDEFPGWHTDCEYNREGGGIVRKQVPLPEGPANADPDIIVHRRGTAGPNLLALELKPESAEQRKKDHDVDKLRGYAQRHGYLFAVFVMYRAGAEPAFCEVRRIQPDNPVDVEASGSARTARIVRRLSRPFR